MPSRRHVSSFSRRSKTVSWVAATARTYASTSASGRSIHGTVCSQSLLVTTAIDAFSRLAAKDGPRVKGFGRPREAVAFEELQELRFHRRKALPARDVQVVREEHEIAEQPRIDPV